MQSHLSIVARRQQEPATDEWQDDLDDAFHESARDEEQQKARRGFVANWMVHASLPYQKPIDRATGKEAHHWVRRNGNVQLIVQSGMEVADNSDLRETAEDRPSANYIGVPYGSMPRIVIAYFATEVVITRSPEIRLGNSVREFFGKLGLHATGGQYGSITSVRNQLKRLLHATIKVEYRRNDRRREWNQLLVGRTGTDGGPSWWLPAEAGQRALWQPTITLSNEFFEGLRYQAVPVDLRAVQLLSQSPIAIDLYLFLTYRFASLEQELTIPWLTLQRQFGSDSTKHKFAENVKRAIVQVERVYPSARVVATTEGLKLRPSLTSIPAIGRASGN